jgi:two-component sensor histidine kinase
MLNAFSVPVAPQGNSALATLQQWHYSSDCIVEVNQSPGFNGECGARSLSGRGVSVQRARLLAPLLASASLTSCKGSLLRPIWAMEAMRRAYNMIRLVGLLDRKAPLSDTDSHRPDFENRLAAALAATFDSLAIERDEVLRPCSIALRSLTQNLVELFGSAIGDIALSTCVDRLVLPAFQQRALILLTSELVTNVLLHAFNDRIDGRIVVELWVPTRGDASLTISNDGNLLSSIPHQQQAGRCSMAGDLADLLQGDVVYTPRVGGGQIANVTFRYLRAQ